MPLATADDFRARLGRDLNPREAVQVPALIDSATELVAEAANTSSDVVLGLSPVPSGLKVLVVEACVRVLLNPDGLSSYGETLGAHQISKGFRPAELGSGNLALTDAERLRARKLVIGIVTGSAPAPTVADEIASGFSYPPWWPPGEPR